MPEPALLLTTGPALSVRSGGKMKIRDWLKNTLPYLVLAVILSVLFTKRLGSSGDELWNYNFARNILHGRMPYRDFNMLQTPASAYLSAFFLLLLGEGLLQFRIIGFFLGVLCFGMLFAVGKEIVKDALIPFLTAVFSAIVFTVIWEYDYNHLNLVLILFIMCLELRHPGRDGIGLLYGLLPIIKQSTGGVLLLLWMGFCAVDFRRNRNLKILLRRLGCSCLPGAVFGVWLLCTGSFSGFWDYAVRGIATFRHRSTYLAYLFSSPLCFAVGAVPVLVTIFSLWAIRCSRGRVERRTHLRLLMISLAGAVVAYPICDTVHMLAADVPFLACWFCCLKERKITKKERLVCVAVAMAVTGFLAVDAFRGLDGCKISGLRHFEGIPVSPEMEQTIEMVDNYILECGQNGQRVVIANEAAAMFVIPIDQYNGDFDMLLAGNHGTKSVEKLLEDKTAYYLVIRDEAYSLPQAHRELVHYIKENYTKIDEKGNFDVYKK